MFPVWISFDKNSEFAGTLPRKFIQHRHLVVGSTTVDPGARGGECSSLPPKEKISEDVAVIAATDTSPAKTVAIMQTKSQGSTEMVKKFFCAKLDIQISLHLRRRVCCPVRATTVNLI